MKVIYYKKKVETRNKFVKLWGLFREAAIVALMSVKCYIETEAKR